ncbi:hypothetical protein AAES_169272 [Amazona aestiva]|uniref:Uncharacterized protein n=1 Tax=Amazona aestiva TaxID=12930 RepID=A0A0Q3LW84_AMAAE|nr:hypothetical protein AAES_169272 [Amazona aestiva]
MMSEAGEESSSSSDAESSVEEPSICGIVPTVYSQDEGSTDVTASPAFQCLDEIDELLISDSRKDVNQNSGSTGNTEQSLNVYHAMNNTVTETSQANVAFADLMLIHVDPLAVRTLKSWNDAYLQCLNVA